MIVWYPTEEEMSAYVGLNRYPDEAAEWVASGYGIEVPDDWPFEQGDPPYTELSNPYGI